MKKNGGFTLIELLAAIAVLSIMTSVLLQNFVVSRRLSAKAAKEERVLNAAKRTMEELKGYSFEKLDLLAEGNPRGRVEIAGRLYEYGPLTEVDAGTETGTQMEVDAGTETGMQTEVDAGTETGTQTEAKASAQQAADREGYRLVAECRLDPSDSDGEAGYLISAEVDWGRYNREEEGDSLDELSSYSVNRYRMPKIADVGSFQNVVLEPAMLAGDDERLTEELLLQVNPAEDGGGNSDGGGRDMREQEDEIIYDEGDIRKYLQVDIDETGGETGRLSVRTKAIYTVGEDEDFENPLSLTADLMAFKKQVVLDPKTKKPVNRIYIFLPDDRTAEAGGGTVHFEKVFIFASLERNFELYVVAPSASGLVKEDFLLFAPGARAISQEELDTASGKHRTLREREGDNASSFSRETEQPDGSLILFTNIGDEKPVSLSRPKKRLYRLTVSVYEAEDKADYKAENGDKRSDMGKEILKLESTKLE